MKLKSFFQKFIAFFIFIIFIFNFSCSNFKYTIAQFSGENDNNYLNQFYPINSDNKQNPINETMNFCSFFIDEKGVLYSLIIELNKLILNNTEFWFYELFFYDYSPLQKQGKNSSDNKPIIIKITQTSINPMTPIKVKDRTITFGQNLFSWKDNKILLSLKDKKNSIKITANLYQKNNFSILGNKFVKHSSGTSLFFISADLPVECEYTFYYSDKEKVKKKLKNGVGLIYKNWGTNTLSEYELHFMKFSEFKLGDNQIQPTSNLSGKSYIIFAIPKVQFYHVLEIQKDNQIPVFKSISNFNPEYDYTYSKVIPDKNRRYPSNFNILLNNSIIRINPFYEKSTVQFFTHDSWFGITPIYDSVGILIGLGFSNIYEYSRMK